MPERAAYRRVRSSRARNPMLPHHRNRGHDLPRPRHPEQDRRDEARGRLPASPNPNRMSGPRQLCGASSSSGAIARRPSDRACKRGHEWNSSRYGKFCVRVF